jgi:hypothetical protein
VTETPNETPNGDYFCITHYSLLGRPPLYLPGAGALGDVAVGSTPDALFAGPHDAKGLDRPNGTNVFPRVRCPAFPGAGWYDVPPPFAAPSCRLTLPTAGFLPWACYARKLRRRDACAVGQLNTSGAVLGIPEQRRRRTRAIDRSLGGASARSKPRTWAVLYHSIYRPANFL